MFRSRRYYDKMPCSTTLESSLNEDGFTDVGMMRGDCATQPAESCHIRALDMALDDLRVGLKRLDEEIEDMEKEGLVECDATKDGGCVDDEYKNEEIDENNNDKNNIDENDTPDESNAYDTSIDEDAGNDKDATSIDESDMDAQDAYDKGYNDGYEDGLNDRSDRMIHVQCLRSQNQCLRSIGDLGCSMQSWLAVSTLVNVTMSLIAIGVSTVALGVNMRTFGVK